MNRIDILVYKHDEHDVDAFNEDILSYSNNSIILNWTNDKIWVHYKPSNVTFRKNTVNFFRMRNQRLSYLFSPFLLAINVFRLSKLFTVICWKFRPKVFLVENFLEGMIAGIIRRCKLVDKSIYLPSDWFAGYKYKKIFSHIANNLLFPYIDYLACKLNDVVLNRPDQVAEMRNNYWGKKIAKKEEWYFPQSRVRATVKHTDGMKKNICFIGEMRIDSGLDIAIRSLDKIRKHYDITFKIIGSKRLYYDYFLDLSKQHKVDRYVHFLGFVERKDFNEVLSDCFCGINILKSMNSYSSHVIPSKIIHYLQYLLPVIVSEGANRSILLDIIKNELGVIIKPYENEFIDAILKVYFEQTRYRENIISYLESFPKTSLNIKEYVEI